jgi:Zn-dependent M28 family amino/carboxypeptidase
VVSVMEIASALATLTAHPKRSILFMTVFGEEEGLLGSYYYVRHPLVPLKDTVAEINLEQMGRTDDNHGPEVGAFAFTGPSYSDLPSRMGAAARAEGVKVYAGQGADSFFDRSDNYAFALAGIVAHTVVVAFDYPDYHGLGDEWRKIDYANMAKVDRGLAAGLLDLADSDAVPKWSGAKETQRYREAAGR